ncbi:hypothetical protein F4780DRAFT_796431 [Xylariomycetidae sp. FL0641]|nr:hypothetical protein F4780DRAFT_796431 [Xylariomycetidae sp. FL0641]
MCVRMSRLYKKCGHVDSETTPCARFHKEQASKSSFFSRLFRSSPPSRKDCGRVFPHPLELDGYCQACSVRSRRLRAEHVGHGAVRVTQRPAVEESFAAAAASAPRTTLKKKRSTSNTHSQRQHQTGSSSSRSHARKPDPNDVWLPHLYQHPETHARTETYARGPAPAPPVSARPEPSRSSSSRLQKKSAKDKPKEPHATTRGHDRASRKRARAALAAECRPVPDSSSSTSTPTPPRTTPAYGSASPLAVPAPPAATHAYRGRFAATSGPAGPAPERPLPSLPPQLERPLPPPPPKVVGAQFAQPPYPELKRRAGREPLRRTPITPAAAVPEHEPAYQTYLRAMAPPETDEEYAARMRALQARAIAAQQASTPKSAGHRLHDLGRRLGLEFRVAGDDGSDLSFVCQDSRAICPPRDRPQAKGRR